MKLLLAVSDYTLAILATVGFCVYLFVLLIFTYEER